MPVPQSVETLQLEAELAARLDGMQRVGRIHRVRRDIDTGVIDDRIDEALDRMIESVENET